MTHGRGNDQDPRSPGDGELPDLPAEWGKVVIPDDLAELAEEAAGVRAELLAARHRTLPARMLGIRRRSDIRRRSRLGLAGPAIVLMSVLVTVFAVLVVLVLPRTGQLTARAPLAAPDVPAGQVGGLVPLVGLVQASGTLLPLRDLRPAVLLLAPVGCSRCSAVGAALIAAARDSRVQVVLVADAGRPVALPPDAARGRAVALADPQGTLFTAVTARSATGPTAVLVRADGVISRIIPDVNDVAALRGELANLAVF